MVASSLEKSPHLKSLTIICEKTRTHAAKQMLADVKQCNPIPSISKKVKKERK